MIIAQLSDTHILARSSESAAGVARADSLRRCVADINRRRPDAVVHTGDIVQHGRPEEYAHVRDLLAPLEAPLYLVPGNRDDREALRIAFADHGYLPCNGMPFHYTVDDHALRLVAIDSTDAGERKGVFGADRQGWLDDTLNRAPQAPTVLLIHHPPFDVGDHYVGGYRRRGDAEALAAVVGRHRQVVRLLCGHVHCPTEVPWAGTTATIMPSVAPDVRKGVEAHAPMYHLHTMTDAGLVTKLQVVA